MSHIVHHAAIEYHHLQYFITFTLINIHFNCKLQVVVFYMTKWGRILHFKIIESNIERAFFLETQDTGNRTQDTGGLNWIGQEIRDDSLLQWFQLGMHSIHEQIQDRSQQSDYQRWPLKNGNWQLTIDCRLRLKMICKNMKKLHHFQLALVAC